MSRRPAQVTQADVARIIRAARQAGARTVEIPVGNQVVIVRLDAPDALAPRPANGSAEPPSPRRDFHL